VTTAELLEAEAPVEVHRAVDVGDPVTGVDELWHEEWRGAVLPESLAQKMRAVLAGTTFLLRSSPRRIA